MPTILNLKFETPFETPPFNDIKPGDFLPALKEELDKGRESIDKIVKNPERETFENVIFALEAAEQGIERISSIFFNLLSAETSDELQKISKEFSPLLSEYQNDISLNGELFFKVKKVYEQREKLNLDTEEMTLLDKTYKFFVRNGALLDEAGKKKLREIDQRLSKLSLEFSDNNLAATNAFEYYIENEADLKGLPESAIEAAAQSASEKGRSGVWRFTLQMPSYLPLMTYLDSREIREKITRAAATKCCSGEHDNHQIVGEIAALKFDRANLLGFKNHAEYVLEERMAETPERVLSFTDELLDYAKPAALKEIEELKSYAAKNGGPEDFQSWDYPYWANKLKKERFSIDDEDLRPYFKLENVIDGVFKVASTLFKITFKERRDIPVYHPDVKAYEVKGENDRHMGVFFADFFPREGKRSGAWMTSYRPQWKEGEKNIRPHVSIVCNFTKPTNTKPSLLSFGEVTTLFHEFGHALHMMLSDCRFASLSGTSVYWDFVELPSQIMENWAYEKECLDLFARHYETGELIPQDLIDRLKAASTFHSGRNCVRQLSLGALDMAWFTTHPQEIGDIDSFENKSTERMRLLPEIEGASTSCSFGHIFAGGYSAGYYSYKWAEVLDADAFELFKEQGIFDEKTGKSFKDHILSRGGSEHPMTLYKRFRGKEPDPKALLRRDNLI